ncbi:MAG: hypothetical protein IPM82_16205 [Saprospiraceae bacterium]|nr:hypothetical protein [Saprospiraceae bacterium]
MPKTELPLHVGHDYEDALEQMANRAMTGFVENFKKKNDYRSGKFPKSPDCHPQDVLGYYIWSDLQMYDYLANEFTICDNYYSSHPGPTLPNRMYSLTGHLQHDRNGEPRLNNSMDSTFFLSRDETIFDVLSRYEVKWRVYESFPSVTILRMFSKYAGNTTEIRNIKGLEIDIANNDFPSVVFIDPSMHTAVVNDDHPPADMLNGQNLVKSVYDTLKSNTEIWNNTLFIVTYDEHGGLFDNVYPPIAETLTDPRQKGKGTKWGKLLNPNNEILPDESVQFGLRVPTFLISPYAKKGSVFKAPLDHTSILKSILIRFCEGERPYMGPRVDHTKNFGDALTSQRRINIPQSPKLAQTEEMKKVFTLNDLKKFYTNFKPVSKSSLTSAEADFHDFMAVLSRMTKPF